MIEPPAGYETRRLGDCVLLASPGHARDLIEAGFGDPLRWPRPEAGAPAAGRGVVLRRTLPGGLSVVLKQMKRGGLTAGLWRDRFRGVSRLLDNLVIPTEAIRRGVPTPEPVALWLLAGPPGLYRAWLAVQEIPRAVDLLTALADPAATGPRHVRAALTAVRRMHDAAIDHPDLNLGNLMVRGTGADVEGFVIDLDRATLHTGPLPVASRRAALLRLERSYLKRFGPGRGPARPEHWRRWYAAGDERLAAALLRARTTDRLSLALHRLAWSLRRAPDSRRDSAGGPPPRGPSPR